MIRNTVFSQILQLLSRSDFKKCVDHYEGDKYTKRFTCWQQLLVLLYAQSRGLNSLRDITVSLQSQHRKWYHLGLQSVARSTLADANNHRRTEIYRDAFYGFLSKCQRLAPTHKFRFKNPLYTMDSSLFPWARFRRRKGALKIHTLLDHRGCLPSFITVTDGRFNDLRVVKDEQYNFPQLLPDSILTIDRGYFDCNWLYSLTLNGVFFVTRAKENFQYEVLGQHKVSQKKEVINDQVVRLTGRYQKEFYPDNLRLVTYYDAEKDKMLEFLTNNFKLAAATIAELYKARWEIEKFFKWIKQNLKIKTFLGTSQNAVMTQIWAAMIYYLLLAFIKFQTKYSYSMHELTRVVGELLMEYVPMIETLSLKFEKLKLLKYENPQMALPLKI